MENICILRHPIRSKQVTKQFMKVTPSKLILPKKCLKFAYHMYGDEMGQL